MKNILFWLIIIILSYMIAVKIDQIFFHPTPKNIKVINGIIHHPTYGKYPQRVPYKQGMSLMPGQEAIIKIQINKESK